MNDNAEEKKPEAVDPKQAMERTQNQLAMLMDDIKSLFLPEMKLTLISRHPTDADCISVLTEESDLEILCDAIKSYAPKLTPVPRHESKAEN